VASVEGEGRTHRVRSFLIGGVLGASATIAAMRRRRARGRARTVQAGLTAFEGAPCYRELVERDRLSEDGT
jgi:hypothetical protein